MLTGMQPSIFAQFSDNSEHFITEAIRLIKEQKATMIIERLRYDMIEDRYDIDIFTSRQSKQDFSKATGKLRHHIYDYLIADSAVERRFANELDISSDIVVYAKLPKTFSIPTPLGNYTPDWAISFKEGSVKHVYFVAETKHNDEELHLRGIEKTKIDCAHKFFDELNSKMETGGVKYSIVTDFGALMAMVH